MRRKKRKKSWIIHEESYVVSITKFSISLQRDDIIFPLCTVFSLAKGLFFSGTSCCLWCTTWKAGVVVLLSERVANNTCRMKELIELSFWDLTLLLQKEKLWIISSQDEICRLSWHSWAPDTSLLLPASLSFYLGVPPLPLSQHSFCCWHFLRIHILTLK